MMRGAHETCMRRLDGRGGSEIRIMCAVSIIDGEGMMVK